MQHLHCCVSIQYYPQDTVCYQKKGIFSTKSFHISVACSRKLCYNDSN